MLLALASVASPPRTLQPPEASTALVHANCEDPKDGELEFIHIPKTAGTAIEELGLSRRVCWGMNNHKFDSVDRPLGCAKWHTPTRFFSGRVPGKDSPDPFANSTTFCIKRHPFTRAISQYLMEQGLENPPCKSGPYAGCDGVGLNKWVHDRFNPKNDELYVRALATIPSNTLDPKLILKKLPHGNPMLTNLGCHMIPQWLYILHNEHDRGCDKVLKYESLDTEFAALADTQTNLRGLSTATKVVHPGHSHFGSSEVHLPASELNATSRALLMTAYRLDFQMLGYSPHDLEGLNDLHVVTPQDALPFIKGQQQLRATEGHLTMPPEWTAEDDTWEPQL
jgi:hypothetical protein